MAIRIDRPSAGPFWLESVLASVDRLVTRLSREKVGRLRRDFGYAEAQEWHFFPVSAGRCDAVKTEWPKSVAMRFCGSARRNGRSDEDLCKKRQLCALSVPSVSG